jgi:D-sedoheptulose 7-phosphate isomerase
MTISEDSVTAAFDRRTEPAQALAAEAERVARACHAMAVRFHRGGKMIVFGNGAQATDAAHIAVEFVHPVIVGKHALPALSLAADPNALTGVTRRAGFEETYAAGVRLMGAPADIAVGLSADGQCENVRRGLAAAHEMGLLTVALVGGDGGRIAGTPPIDHTLVIHADDPRVVKEVNVTAYHILWELVHVFLEQPGVLEPEPGR